MAIVRAPLKSDAAGKCSRWRVVIYNRQTHKQEWHTVEGTRAQAKEFEREQQRRIGKGTYVAKRERKTVAAAIEAFIAQRTLRNRRSSTLAGYASAFNRYIVPELGARELGTLTEADAEQLFAKLRADGTTIATVNRVLHVLKILLNFAIPKWLETNPLRGFAPYPANGPRIPQHIAFTEEELQKLLAAATPAERALVCMLAFTGARPGEVFALRWGDLDLEGGSVHVARSWDHRGRTFVDPKTEAGIRTADLSKLLVAELLAHRARCGDPPAEALVFPNGAGRAHNPSNLRRDLWLPLLKRAGLAHHTMYSCRHTFVSLARAAGEEKFAVARQVGHKTSKLVDAVYARTLPSAIAGMSERVTRRAMAEKPQLRIVVDNDQRDVREPLDEAAGEGEAAKVSA